MQESVYFRRCHICGAVTHINEDKAPPNCSHCGKAWAPFQFFDDRHALVVGDKVMRPQYLAGEWHPIQGLTVYWESF